MNNKLPVVFVSHGSPMLMVDRVDGADYRQWGAKLGKPRALLIVSAHWETEDLCVGEITQHEKLIYDFGGFPEALYRVQYPAPGAPWLVDTVETLLERKLGQVDRGLDHGVYVPLIHMWPKADVPVLQLSLPRNLSDEGLYQLGKQLAPLREHGVLIIGAGALTHNLRAFDPQNNSRDPLPWARVFDDWVGQVLMNGDTQSLINWRKAAPEAKMNHPTAEHFTPLLIAAGAGEGEAITFPTLGFTYGAFTRRSVQFG